MPKPSATTLACNRNRERSLLSAGSGCETLRPKIIPTVSAIGGETYPLAEMIRPAKNRVLMRIVLKLSPAISYCIVLLYARQQQRQHPQFRNAAIRDRAATNRGTA